MKKILLSVFVASFILLGFIPQPTSPSVHNNIIEIIKKLNYYSHLASERTIVYTDKDYYQKGETIWFRVFLTNGLANLEKPNSGVVYVEVLNEAGSIVEKRKLNVLDNGSYGDVAITNKWNSGKYYLRAFTKLMLNNNNPRAIIKPIVVEDDFLEAGNVMTAPIISVVPEGGALVSGVNAAVGVKAINGKGERLGEKGVILDSRDNVVTDFELISPGYGKAYFTPVVGENYRLRIDTGIEIYEKPLPRVEAQGYSLNVKERGGSIVVGVTGLEENNLKGCVLLVHKGEIPLSTYELGNQSGDAAKFLKINKEDLGNGVVSFSLFNQIGEAKCQRSLNLFSEAFFVNLEVEKDVYRVGEPIRLRVNGSDYLKDNFSLSVVLKDRVRQTLADASLSQKHHLLSDQERREAIDAMMIVDEKGIVDWDQINQFEVDDFRYKPELGIMVSGNIALKGNVEIPKSKISLTVNGGIPFQESKIANSSGDFDFGPYSFYDSLNVLLHVSDIGSKVMLKDGVEIELFNNWPKYSSGFTDSNKQKNSIDVHGIEESKDDNAVSNEGVTKLDEVVVKSDVMFDELVRDREYGKLTPYFNYSNRVVADSLKHNYGAVSALDLLIQTPGVNITGIYPDQKVFIRGVGSINESVSPLFLINGVPTSAQAAKQLLAEEVMFVDVIKGGRAAAFGARGGNGVIAFYTKRGQKHTSSPIESINWVNATIPGFSKTKKFEDYVSSRSRINDPKKNLVYWAPNLEIDNDSVLEIRASNRIGEYSIVLQGLDENGYPLRLEKTIEIVE
ncbi:TonB-dependent Receptor Plug Domain [Maribacter dokdonensis]|uniref:TonB-dependent Receptor Plug Domain n=1 Tax=Maribacter dokdonensis TaxID=320912 RepID=A0A1H4MTQ7_9FLAO|nr:TonB-dependent receptor plug domain-containing protein [Maribacter dokdonensis]SEB86038.1 TonB-dependent Receptor Plug Domain [Maribacter dokdonensis]